MRTLAEKVRVIVPDFGGGFGGKHTGETAIEAARLAKAAGKPVALHWTRPEEFTWAYFRPAGVIKAEASLDADGKITSWFAVNINSGANALRTPYRTGGRADTRTVAAAAPLRHGSYRGLAATANTFANESLMDELAHAAGQDPLEFRWRTCRIPACAVLEEAAKKFDWHTRAANRNPTSASGWLAAPIRLVRGGLCRGQVDPQSGQIKVRALRKRSNVARL